MILIRPNAFLILLSVLLLFCFGAMAKPRRVMVHWIDKDSSADLGFTKTPQARMDSLSAIAWSNKIVNKLRERRYWLASVDSFRCTDTTFIFAIYCGHAWNGGIRIENEEVSSNLNEKLFSPQYFLSSFHELLNQYANTGYPFVQLKPDSVSLRADSLYVRYTFDKGLRLRFGNLNFGTKVKVDSLFWYRWLAMKPGQFFNQESVDLACKRIEETGFSRCADVPQLSFASDSSVAIDFDLEKIPSSQIDAMMGLGQNKETSNLEFTGSVQLLLKNYLKKAEEINLNWQRTAQSRMILLINYDQKYLFGTPFGAEANLNIERLDTLQINSLKRLNVHYYLQPQTSVYAFVSNKSSNILTNSTRDSSLMANSSFTLGGLGLKTYQFDYKFNPRRGYELLFETGSGSKHFEMGDSSGNITQLEMKFSVSLYVPLGKKNWTIKFRNQTAYMQSSRLFFNEQYFFGGNRTLRGYTDDQLQASKYTIFTTELRYLFAKTSNFYLFFDQAAYKTLSSATVKTPFGFGIGVNLKNKNSIFSLCYAIGGEYSNTLLLGKGKFNFGFVTLF